MSEHGAALVAVLFVLLVCELAIVLLTTEVQQLAQRVALDRDRMGASRLAESGLEHALAQIASASAAGSAAGAGAARAVRLTGTLAEGRYEVAWRGNAAGELFIVSRGRTWSGRRMTLRFSGRLKSGVVTPTARDWRHDLG